MGAAGQAEWYHLEWHTGFFKCIFEIPVNFCRYMLRGSPVFECHMRERQRSSTTKEDIAKW
jgi:hypothetical protein